MKQRQGVEAPTVRSPFTFPPALRYPSYRAYWLGTLASVSGFQVLIFSQGWLAYEMTGSPFFLRAVWMTSAVPAILLNLFGGVYADKLDKRRLIMATQTITASLIFLLATLTLLDLMGKWPLLAIAFVTGGVSAFDQPARQALYPHLIDRKAMMSAVALNSSVWQGTRIVAPAVAGLVINILGTEASFYLAGVGFLTMAAVIYGLKIPHIESGGTGNAGQDIMEGLRFIKGNSVFSFLIGMTFFNSFFGMAYVALMPIFAKDILEVGASGQGWLLSVSGVGALITTLWLSSLGTFRRKGLLIIGGATMFGLVVATFALTSEFVGSYFLALALMFTMGVCASAYMVSIMTSLQLMVPDRLRGRVMGFYGMTWSIMPLGGGQAGAIASAIGAPVTIAIGGLAVTAFALGPAMINRHVRNLGALLIRVENARLSEAGRYQPAASTTDE